MNTNTRRPPPTSVFPQIETAAHAADLGMVFYSGRMSRRNTERALLCPARLLENDASRSPRDGDTRQPHELIDHVA
jgi:hypothetical protein